MANQTHSLAHTKWMCKYHIVFTPKYRRKAIYSVQIYEAGKIKERDVRLCASLLKCLSAKDTIVFHVHSISDTIPNNLIDENDPSCIRRENASLQCKVIATLD